MKGLSVYLNYLFADGQVDAAEETLVDGVRRSAAAGADAVDVRPWDADALDGVVSAAEAAGLEVAYLSGRDDHVPLTDPTRTAEAVAEIEAGLRVAERVGCRTLNVKAGPRQPGVDRLTQHEHVVSVLRRVAGSAAEAGVTLVLEPVSDLADSPNEFVTSAREGGAVVDAVDSPSVKLLFDVYHEQITAGDVVRTVRAHAEDFGHVHVADVPGRHEPGTGELNYRTVLAELAEAGYDGYVGCEFYPTTDPETAIRAVRDLL